MEIPSFFMGKIIVTLFPFTDIPSGMKPSAAKSSVLTRHPGSALNSRKVPKMPCFCGFYGVGSNEPVDEPSGFKRRGKIKLYQRRSYYAEKALAKASAFCFFIETCRYEQIKRPSFRCKMFAAQKCSCHSIQRRSSYLTQTPLLSKRG